MSKYTRPMAFTVEVDREGGLLLVIFRRAPSVGGVEILDAGGELAGVVHVDADREPLEIEIFDAGRFPLDACAAEFGFTGEAGAIGVALGSAELIRA